MTSLTVWIIVLLLAAVAAARFIRRTEIRQAAQDAPLPDAPAQPYRCVSISPQGKACAVARRLDGLRFLADKAPRLPLPGCAAERCSCVYAHYDDRRYHARRDPWARPALEMYRSEIERRSAAGRRRTDALHHPGV